MADTPPFSRPVRVDTPSADGLVQTIEASAAERAALAALNRLPAIASLSATFTLHRSGRNGMAVTGVVRAEVTQVCIVTLEPFAASVEEPVDVVFAQPAPALPARREEAPKELHIEPGEPDPPDEIIDGMIDLGALAAEFLALGLDPYPRKPGVEFAAPAAQVEATSPFAELAALKADAKAKPGRKN